MLKTSLQSKEGISKRHNNAHGIQSESQNIMPNRQLTSWHASMHIPCIQAGQRETYHEKNSVKTCRSRPLNDVARRVSYNATGGKR